MAPSRVFTPCSMIIGAFPGKPPSLEAPTSLLSKYSWWPLCQGTHRSRKACYALVKIYCLSALQKKLIALYMKSTLHFNSQCSAVADVIDAMETILSPSLENSILTNTSSVPWRRLCNSHAAYPDDGERQISLTCTWVMTATWSKPVIAGINSLVEALCKVTPPPMGNPIRGRGIRDDHLLTFSVARCVYEQLCVCFIPLVVRQESSEYEHETNSIRNVEVSGHCSRYRRAGEHPKLFLLRNHSVTTLQSLSGGLEDIYLDHATSEVYFAQNRPDESKFKHIFACYRFLTCAVHV